MASYHDDLGKVLVTVVAVPVVMESELVSAVVGLEELPDDGAATECAVPTATLTPT